MLSALRSAARGALRAASLAHPPPAAAAARALGTSRPSLGVEEFLNQGLKHGEYPKAGRAWEAADLRLKSYDDLHKLWYVLLKERNLLHTERMAARTAREKFVNPGRLAKVRKAMARLKHVLTERAIAEHAGDEDALQAAKDRINQL